MPESLPPAGKFVDDSLKTLFKETIDQVIADLGRTVTLYFSPSASGCPNCFAGPDGSSNGLYDGANPFPLGGAFNKPFPTGGRCPVCKTSHKILTEQSKDYTANIGRAPKDSDFTQEGTSPENVVTTKMQIVAFDDIKRSKKALIDGELYVLLRDPIKTGLQNLDYVRAFWRKLTE